MGVSLTVRDEPGQRGEQVEDVALDACRKHVGVFFVNNVSDVCPEPVLANVQFSAAIKWRRERDASFRHFILKCIILPRQAREKHRESAQKGREMRFLAAPMIEEKISTGLRPIESPIPAPIGKAIRETALM